MCMIKAATYFVTEDNCLGSASSSLSSRCHSISSSSLRHWTRELAMGGPRFGRSAKQRAPLSFCWKVSLAFLVGLSFIMIWSIFSSPSSSIYNRRDSFDDIDTDPSAPMLATSSLSTSRTESTAAVTHHTATENSAASRNDTESLARKTRVGEKKKEKEASEDERALKTTNATGKPEETSADDEEQTRDAGPVGQEEPENSEEVAAEMDVEIEDGVDVNPEEENTSGESEAGEGSDSNKKRKKNKNLGPLFDATARYDWKLCGGTRKQNYIPCIDMEGAGGRRHHERSCPRGTVTCLVPLPKEYGMPVPWPESKFKVRYGNVAHPKLSAFIKTNKLMNVSGEYLRFSSEESNFNGGVQHYLDSIEEMVPDIEWGKNVRIVLNIGCSDASFVVSLLGKDVITLSLDLMSDQRDLAQVLLERGIPSVVGNLGTRRLPFPAGVFDAVHCSGCNIHWYSNGGRLLLDINRVLRPGGFFIFSMAHGDAEREEGMSSLVASICWNVLAHKTDDTSELDIMIYQRPLSNDIYSLRRRNEPPFCKGDENQDIAWYVPIESCLHKLPTALEERGTDWPEEWPSRLETFPEWLGDAREKIIADNEHWNAIINKSYLVGMGIDWTNVRNVMDMKAIYGGFAAGLASQKVWVMNVVPVHAPNTLPIIYERGLVGIYHDWCEPFSTHPRSYDLLHADHLFSRLKNRCKQPIVIVVEMDRILRPGGWVIIRDKSVILNPLEKIFKTMHWDVRLTFNQGREGIICLKKTMWRPSA